MHAGRLQMLRANQIASNSLWQKFWQGIAFDWLSQRELVASSLSAKNESYETPAH